MPAAAAPKPSSHPILAALGLAILALGVTLLVDPARAPAHALLQPYLPAELQLPSFRRLTAVGFAINLVGLGVHLNHQAATGGRRVVVGVLCAASSASALLFYLSHRAGGAVAPTGLALMAAASLATPLACAALLAYAMGGAHAPAAYAPTSFTALGHGLLVLGLGVAAMVMAPGAARTQLHPLLAPEGVEGGLCFASALALGTLALHSGVNDPKAAATQMCATGTMALAWAYAALMKPKAAPVLWPLAALYVVLAALGMAETSSRAAAANQRTLDVINKAQAAMAAAKTAVKPSAEVKDATANPAAEGKKGK